MSEQRDERNMFRQLLSWGDLRRSPHGLTPAILLGAIFFTGSFSIRLTEVAAPNIAQDLNLDLRVMLGILAVIHVISIVSLPILGWVSDRINRIRMIGAGILFGGLFYGLVGRATNTGTLAAPASAGNIASDAVAVPLLAVLSDYYPVETRGRIFAGIGMLGTVGELLSLVVVGVLVTGVGWRTSHVIIGAATAVLGVIILLVLREPARGYFERRASGFDEEASNHEDPPQSFGEGWRTIWAIRSVRRLFLAQLFTAVGFAPFFAVFQFFLAYRYGLNPTQRSLLAFPSVVIGIVAAVLGGGLIDVLGKRSPSSIMRVLGLLTMIPLLGFLIMAFQPRLVFVVFAFVIVSFGTTIFQPAYLSLVSQVVPAHVRGQGIQVMNLARLPGQIALGLVFGPIAATYGFGSLFLACTPFIVLAGIMVYASADFFPTDKRNMIIATAAGEEARRAAAEGRTKLLVVRNLNVSYGENQVLFGVDFEAEEGEIIALLGTNGAGKSTLLRAIAGIQEASDGAIIVDGRDTTHMPPHEIAGRGIVMMPGGRGVFPGLTVEDNLQLARWLIPGDKDDVIGEAYELFPVLKERRDSRAQLLSGGEQQMLALAQAFLAKPKLLMIDELSLGLSPAAVAELVKQVQEINRRGTTVIVVEQSVTVALGIAQRAVFMEKGEIRFVGKTSELLRRPDIVRSVYVRGATANGHAKPQRRDETTERPVVLDVKGVVKRFGGVTALDGVDISLAEGEVLGIIGPNGSGKTTLFDVISGYQPADEGSIVYAGQDVTSLQAHERARLGLVRRFQDARLFPSLTVMESLLVAFDQRMDTSNLVFAAAGGRGARRNERRARERAQRLINLLDLNAYSDKFVKELSTGLRRIVDIAWVLATEPKVLLLDEPSSGIAQAETRLLAPLLRRVRSETGCSILIIEHDISLVSEVADELVAMAVGKVITRGLPDVVLDDPRVGDAFLGGKAPAR